MMPCTEIVDCAPIGEINMHEAHREAAEQHERAAHEERALEYADHAYRLAKEAHSKSEQMVTV